MRAMVEDKIEEHGEGAPMIRRRFLTPKVRRGQLATGDQVLAYVEKVNLAVLAFVCVIGIVCATIFGGSTQVYGALCGGLASLILSLISVVTLRYRAVTRTESGIVQAGGYVTKFAVLIAFFLVLSHFAYSFIDVRVAAVVVILFLLIRLVFSSVIIMRTPVALDVTSKDEE